MAEIPHEQCPTANVIVCDPGNTPEIAAIMNYQNTTLSQVNARKMVVVRHDGLNQTIAATSRLWEPLAYPMFFPHGTLGWGIPGGNAVSFAHRDRDDPLPLQLDNAAGENVNETVNADTEEHHGGEVCLLLLILLIYRLSCLPWTAVLLREECFHFFGRLTNEYLVDMFSCNLDCRLSYIRQNQKRIRAEDAELMGEQNIPDSENIYLPASFLGSWRWASNQVSDCLAIATAMGGPTFFITMTCNSKWDEIKSRLGIGQDYPNIPIDVVHVFKRKLSVFEQGLRTMFPNSGGQVYSVHSIEF